MKQKKCQIQNIFINNIIFNQIIIYRIIFIYLNLACNLHHCFIIYINQEIFMAFNKTKNILITFTLCSLFLSTGCMENLASSGFSGSHKFGLEKGASESDGIVALKEVFDSSVEKIPTLSAVGYAVVSSQPGRTDAQKRLMAIRSARMAALRELAEQIHGIQIDSNTTVIDLMVQNDTFRAVVKGLIRGAKTVRINPTGEDTYETVLEIDRDMMIMMLRNAKRT
jgi:hypothetical protein